MGMGVAKRLLARGYAVSVRDIRREAEDEARAAGATVCASPAEVAAASPVVVTVVVDARQTEEVVFGPRGLAEGMSPGGVLVMCSTVSPEFSGPLAERLAPRGILALDAPISGGPARAHDGTMSMMVAGEPAAYEKARAVLEAISGKRFRVSARTGDGSKMKLVNNLMAGINLAAACEGMVFGLKLGLDPQTIFDVVSASSGASWAFGDRMPRVLSGDYSTKAAVDILAKDLGLALAAGAAARAALPIGGAARQSFIATSALGHGQEDDAAVAKYYARVAGVALPGPERA
jgi:3-hydroxyisobutyrate dehydrogenase-like beta-hydroxyacid dehydrogenase